MTYCAVKLCRNRQLKTESLSFFRFPRDPLKCQQWMENCQTTFKTTDPEIISRRYRVCGVHFEDRMFLNPRKRNRLTHYAVPTLFGDNVRDKEIKLKVKEMEEFVADVVPLCSSSVAPHSSSYIGDVPMSITISDREIINDIRSENSSLPIILQASTSDSSYQTPLYLIERTPNEFKLLDLVKAHKKEIKTLKKKLNTANQQLTQFNTVSHMLKLCKLYLPPSLFLFIEAHIYRKNKKTTGFRYCNDFKELALSIYFLGPETYIFLQKILALPTLSTLKRIFNSTIGKES